MDIHKYKIPGIENYFITKSGDVFGPKGKIKPRKGGYKKKYLRISAYKKDYYLQRIMLETFVGPQPKGMQACHNDGNPHNNNIENLRWDTPKNNSRDKIKHGTSGVGEKNSMAKISDNDAVIITKIYPLIKTIEIAKIYNVSTSLISAIVTGKVRHNKNLDRNYIDNKKIAHLRMVKNRKEQIERWV